VTAVFEDQQVEVVEDEATQAATDTSDESKSRDFSKFTEKHQELADYINSHADYVSAGLAPITPNQVKAAFALRTEFNNTPEVKAAREARKVQLAEEKKLYAGLTQEEIKAEKAAKRAEAQAAKLQARVQAALEKAKAIREGKDASGEDVAAAVDAAVGDDSGEKRRIGRKR
jgi:uncharacterized protein YozE (UPF0346 family)